MCSSDLEDREGGVEGVQRRRQVALVNEHVADLLLRDGEVALPSDISGVGLGEAFGNGAGGVEGLNLTLMRLIDEQHMRAPYYGARQMVRHLRREGYVVSRKRVRRLMQKMGLCVIYQRPRTTVPAADQEVYPYLLHDLVIDRPNQVWCADTSASICTNSRPERRRAWGSECG